MVVDVILAEAVVAHAARAVAKLQLRMIHIRAAADGAFIVIRLVCLLALDAPGLALEVHRFLPLAHVRRAEKVKQPVAAVDQIVEHRHHRQQVQRERRRDDAEHEQRRVHICQILHLDRDDEKQQHLHIRIERGKGKKHRQVQVRSRDDHVAPEDGREHHAVDCREQHAAHVIDREFAVAPLAFEARTDPVVKIQHHQQPDGAGLRRHKHIRHQAPDLPVQDALRRAAQQRGDLPGRVHFRQQPDGRVADDDDQHQVRNAKTRVRIAKPVDFVHQFSHWVPP